MNEELDNEEVVEEDVPETSEEETAQEEVVVNASQDNEEDIDKLVEERANKLFEEKISDRLAKDRSIRERDFQKELSKYKELENIMKAGLGVGNVDEAIAKSTEFYEEQGIEIPKFKDSYSERREQRLAKLDAQDIIDLGKEEMEMEANKLSKIPLEKMTPYQKAMFDTICSELTDIKAAEELKSKGYDTSIMEDKDFQDFRNQFNVKTSISKIYDMYNKLNGTAVERPKSPGSAKSTTQIKQIKEYYSPEDFDKLTPEDLSNPEIMKVVDKSRLQWYKER